MMKSTTASLTVLAWVLGTGAPLLANAQQAQPAAPVQNAAPVSPPPPLPAPAPPAVKPLEAPVSSTTQVAPPAVSADGSMAIKTNEQGIHYTSGGVGETERELLNALSNQFNLRIMSAMQGGGEYVSDAKVNILDSKGATVLSAISKGPYFLAQLPEGSYTVEIVVGDKTQKQSAQISNKQSQLNFYWR